MTETAEAKTEDTRISSRPFVHECEVMYVSAAPSEHVEEYLEALYLTHEAGEPRAKIATISQRLDISPPSAVQMLRRLERDGYVKYIAREGVELTSKGKELGRRMVRNGRLVEVLMKDKFMIPIDGRVSCGIEHHMTQAFADALCSMLDHPKTCPHGHPIPSGKCCEARK